MRQQISSMKMFSFISCFGGLLWVIELRFLQNCLLNWKEGGGIWLLTVASWNYQSNCYVEKRIWKKSLVFAYLFSLQMNNTYKPSNIDYSERIEKSRQLSSMRSSQFSCLFTTYLLLNFSNHFRIGIATAISIQLTLI